MKRIISLIIAAAMLTAVCLCASSCAKSDGKYRIGIVQLITHDALDAATEGFKAAVIDKLGAENVVFDLQNASGDTAQCATIVNSFVNDNVDLIMANATPALQAAYNATKKIPILGTSVTEYGVALGIENFNGVVGSNVSGTSDLAPLSEQADMILELFPEAKTAGLIYCNAEPNSAYQVKEVTKFLEAKGVSCTSYSFSDSNDIAALTNRAVAECDVIYVPTDNTVANSGAIIGNIVREAKKPVIAGEEGICAKCGVATLSISYYDLGYKTGEMAAQILKGEAKIEEMPIAYAPAVKKYNKDMADALGITLPEAYTEIK